MNKSKGYTLIELVVAIGIIGVLAAFLFASYSRSQAKARDARRKADIGTIGVSLEAYFNDYNAYPEALNFGGQFADNGQVYMKELPQDPKPGQSYCYTAGEDLLSYTMGADYETTMEGTRCAAVGSTPAPTAGPTAGPTPTAVPTATPSGQCFGGLWIEEIGPPGLCAGPGDLSTEGQQVNGGCDAWTCGARINNCNKRDDTCPIFTEPPTHPYFGQGRRFTTCECTPP